MDAMGWVEFGVRAAVALGTTVADLVEAMKTGDVHTVEKLSAVLDEPDRILARAEAVKAEQHRKAVEALAQPEGASER